VAMIEAGDDWTVRDPGIRPGYGYPIRRRMITNILNEEQGPEGYVPGPAYRWPWEGAENFRLVGGMSNHYQGNVWIPEEDDFHFYRETSGVDWDLAKFADAIQEIQELFHITVAPAETWSKADHLFADAGRALGYHIHSSPVALRNCLGTIYETPAGFWAFSRYDSKGTALPWAYIGLNNGLKIIAHAEVEKILIERTPGGPPVASGRRTIRLSRCRTPRPPSQPRRARPPAAHRPESPSPCLLPFRVQPGRRRRRDGGPGRTPTAGGPRRSGPNRDPGSPVPLRCRKPIHR